MPYNLSVLFRWWFLNVLSFSDDEKNKKELIPSVSDKRGGSLTKISSIKVFLTIKTFT